MMNDSVSELMTRFRCECGSKGESISDLLQHQEEHRRQVRHHFIAAMLVLFELSIILLVTRV